jgi:hypothetical protein
VVRAGVAFEVAGVLGVGVVTPLVRPGSLGVYFRAGYVFPQHVRENVFSSLGPHPTGHLSSHWPHESRQPHAPAQTRRASD